MRAGRSPRHGGQCCRLSAACRDRRPALRQPDQIRGTPCMFVKINHPPNCARGRPRRNAGQLALSAELCGDHVTIRPGWAANYATLLVACLAGGRLPRSVIDHWAFNGEDAPILVDDDQEEWRRGFVHITKLAYLAGAFIPLSRLGGAGLDRGARRRTAPSDETNSQPWLRKSVSPSSSDGPMAIRRRFRDHAASDRTCRCSVRRRLGTVRLQRSL